MPRGGRLGSEGTVILDYEIGAEVPDVGDFLVSQGGSTYLVIQAHHVRSAIWANRWRYRTIRSSRDVPEGACVFHFHWYPRSG